MRLPDTLDEELCRFVASWHEKEKRLGGIDVIDFDLPGVSDTFEVNVLESRIQYIEWGERLKNKMQEAGVSDAFEFAKRTSVRP